MAAYFEAGMNEVHHLVIPMDYATGGGMAGSDKYRKLSVEDGVTRMVMGAVACKPHLRLGPPSKMDVEHVQPL